MKQNLSIFTLLTAFVLTLSSGCSSKPNPPESQPEKIDVTQSYEYKKNHPKSYELTLDNATDTLAYVIIDSDSFLLEPKQSKKVSVAPGEHQVSMTTVSDSVVLAPSPINLQGPAKQKLLNTSKITYIRDYTYYTANPGDTPGSYYTFEIDSFVFKHTRAEVIATPDSLLVTSEWDYGLNEATPYSIPDEDKMYDNYKTKLHRKATFVNNLRLMAGLEDPSLLTLEELEKLEGLLNQK